LISREVLADHPGEVPGAAESCGVAEAYGAWIRVQLGSAGDSKLTVPGRAGRSARLPVSSPVTADRAPDEALQIGKSIDGQLVRIAMPGHGQILNVLADPLTGVSQHLVIQSMDQPVCVQNSLN